MRFLIRFARVLAFFENLFHLLGNRHLDSNTMMSVEGSTDIIVLLSRCLITQQMEKILKEGNYPAPSEKIQNLIGSGLAKAEALRLRAP